MPRADRPRPPPRPPRQRRPPEGMTMVRRAQRKNAAAASPSSVCRLLLAAHAPVPLPLGAFPSFLCPPSSREGDSTSARLSRSPRTHTPSDRRRPPLRARLGGSAARRLGGSPFSTSMHTRTPPLRRASPLTSLPSLPSHFTHFCRNRALAQIRVAASDASPMAHGPVQSVPHPACPLAPSFAALKGALQRPPRAAS